MRPFEQAAGGGYGVARAGQFEDVAGAEDFVAGWDYHFGVGAPYRNHHGAAVGMEIKFGQFFAHAFAVGAQRDRRDHSDAGDFV